MPTFQEMMLPILEALKDGKPHAIRDVIDRVSDHFGLSEGERQQKYPTGSSRIIDNRVRWSRLHLKNAELLRLPERGMVQITDAGLRVLGQNPERIDMRFLMQFPEYAATRARWNQREEAVPEQQEETANATPEDMLELAITSINQALSAEILERLRAVSPQRFENIVLELLSSIGYGNGEVTGRSGDDGIDGFVNQDALGLDKVHFQAKRYGEGRSISASQARDFIGSLDMNHGYKGIFITSSHFSTSALETFKRGSNNIVSIDGEKLTDLMIQYDIGVEKGDTYTVKKINTDFFEEPEL